MIPKGSFVSVSSLEGCFQSVRLLHIRDAKSLDAVSEIESHLRSACPVDLGLGTAMFASCCPHLAPDQPFQDEDSTSFALIVNGVPQQRQYITCPTCSPQVLDSMARCGSQWLTLAEYFMDRFPLLDEMSNKRLEESIFKVLYDCASRTTAILPQVYHNLLRELEYVSSRRGLSKILNSIRVLMKHIERPLYVIQDVLESIGRNKDVRHLISPWIEESKGALNRSISPIEWIIENQRLLDKTDVGIFFMRFNETLEFLENRKIGDWLTAQWEKIAKVLRRKGKKPESVLIELNQIALNRFFTMMRGTFFAREPKAKIDWLREDVRLLGKAFTLAQKISYEKMKNKVKIELYSDLNAALVITRIQSLRIELLKFCEECMKVAERIGDAGCWVESNIVYSEMLMQISHSANFTSRALRYLTRALERAVDMKELSFEFRIRALIGMIKSEQGSPEALTHHKRCLEIAETLNNMEAKINTLLRLGVDYYNLGHLDSSAKYALEILNLMKEKQEDQAAGLILMIAYMLLTEIYIQQGMLELCVEYESTMFDMLVRLSPTVELQSYYGKLSKITNMLREKGFGTFFRELDYENYVRSYLASLRDDTIASLRKRGPESLALATNFLSYARGLVTVGDYREALNAVDEATSIVKKLNDANGLAECCALRGRVFLKIGKVKQAVEELMKAVEFESERQRHGIEYAVNLSSIGFVLKTLEKHDQALDYLESAIETAQAVRVSLGSEQGRTFTMNVMTSVFDATYLTLLELAERNPKNAEFYFLKALQLAEQQKSREIIEKFQGVRVTQKSEESKQSYKKLYEIADQLTELNLNKAGLLEQMKMGEISQEEFNKKDAALDREIENLGHRERELQQRVYEQTIDPVDIPMPTKYDVLGKARNLLKDHKNWRILEFILVPRLKNRTVSFMAGGTDITLARLMKEAPEGGAIMDEIEQFDNYGIIAFLIEPDGVKVATSQAPAKDIEELKKDIGDGVSNKDTTKLKELSSRIYSKVIPERIQEELRRFNEGELIIIPDKILNAIPWEIVFDGELFWGLKYSLGRSFSLDLLRITLERVAETKGDGTRAKKLRPLLIGNPTYELLAAEDEVNRISSILERFGISSEKLTRDNATVKKFDEKVSETYGLLHYSGHATFLESMGQLSHLKIYGYDLTAYEIGQKEFPSDFIAVLSACQTGVSKNIEGGEILGLVRGFHLAGATSVVATNWEVWTDSALDTMVEFYTELMSGTNVGEALRRARQSIYEKYNGNILDWAAYSIYGDTFQRVKWQILL